MKALSYVEVEGRVACDLVAAPSHEDCISIGKYLEKYWDATVVEDFDVGFSARFDISMPGRAIILTHDSQTGNILYALSEDINNVIPDILSDLEKRLGAE